MLTRLDKNVSKIPFLDINVSYFLLNKNVNIFLLEENVNNFFGPKCQYVSLDQNVNKLSLLDKKCQYFSIGQLTLEKTDTAHRYTMYSL